MKKRKISKSNVILLIGGIVVMIPVIALAVILLSASKDSSKPIEGKRFNNERTVEVSKTQLSSLEKDISTISSVEKVQIELTTATVRIYADIKNEVEEDQYESVFREIYAKVDNILPIKDYFTQINEKKEYDLEVHLYNDITKKDADDFIYYIFTKNASMVNYTMDHPSAARNEELAKELRGETTSQGSLEGGEDSEEGKDGE